jgi:Putative Ig domain
VLTSSFLALVVSAAPVLTPEVGFGTPQWGNAAEEQGPPRAASSPSSTLVVWQEARGGDNGAELWGALLTGAPGAMQSQTLRISMGVDSERYPAVAYGGGKFLVAWQNHSAGRVMGRFYREDGTAEGDPFPLSFRVGDSLEVAWDGAAFIAVWQAWSGGATDTDVYLAEVSLGGASIERVVSQAPGAQQVPALGCDGARHCLVVWEDSRSAAVSGADLWGSRVDDGLVTDPAGRDVMDAAGDQLQPSVAWAPSNWLVSYLEPQTNDVRGVRLDTAGARLGSGFDLFAGAGNQGQARAVSFGAGFLLVMMSDGVLATQRFDAAGVALDAAAVPILRGDWYVTQPVLAVPAGTPPLALWQDKRWGGVKDVFASSLGPTLEPMEDGGFLVSQGGSGQVQPRVASDGRRYLAVWVEELPEGKKQVVGAEVDLSGAALGGVIDFSGPGDAAEFPLGNAEVAFSNGRYLVAWEGRAASGYSTIFGRTYLPGAGHAESLPYYLCDGGSPSEEQPVLGGGAQQFLLAYRRQDDVYAQRVAAGGAPLDPDGIVVAASQFKDQPAAVRANGSDFVVLWQREDPADWTPHLGRVSAAGAPLDGPNGVTPAMAGFSSGYFPALDCSGSGCLVAWETGGDVYGQLYDSQLSAQRPYPFFLSRAGGAQRTPAVSWRQGRYLAVWTDTRGAERHELYGTMVHPQSGVVEPAGELLVTGVDGLREPALASVGQGRSLLAYTRLDTSPQANASRVQVRAVVDATDGSACAYSPDGVACSGGGTCTAGLCVGGTSTGAGGFTTTPGVFLTCSETFSYNADNRPLVVGPGTPRFSLAPRPGEVLPDGLTVDEATGALSWTPTREQAGQHQVVLVVRGDGWAAAQTLELNVECAERKLAVCGCGAGPGALGLWLLAAGLLRRRRR